MSNKVNNTLAPSKNEQKDKSISVSSKTIWLLKDKADVLMAIGHGDMNFSNYTSLLMQVLGKYVGNDEDLATNMVVITDFHYSLLALLDELPELQHLAYDLDGSNTSEGLLEKHLISIDALENHRTKLVDRYTSMLRTYNVSYELNPYSEESAFFKKELAKLQAEIEKLDLDIEHFKIK